MGLRKDRLADEIRDILAVAFTGGMLRDPRLDGITITAVKLTPDLQLASVYFRLYGPNPEAVAGAKIGLASAAIFLRRRLAESLDIRRVPNLRFFFDESLDRGSRIEHLLNQIHD